MRERESNISLDESVEAYLKAFVMSLNILQLKNKNFLDTSVKAKIQILYGVSIIDKSEKGDDFLQDFFTFNKRGRGKDRFANDLQTEYSGTDN